MYIVCYYLFFSVSLFFVTNFLFIVMAVASQMMACFIFYSIVIVAIVLCSVK